MRTIISIALAMSASTVAAQTFTYFAYAEKGQVGELIVLNERTQATPVKPVAMSLLSGDRKTQHQCEFRAIELTAARIQSTSELSVTMQVLDDTQAPIPGVTFDAVFRKDGVTLEGAQNDYCGLSAMYAGRWRRTTAPK
jgi:hypothetical protein